MRRYCTACRAAVEGQFLCPRCGQATAETLDDGGDVPDGGSDARPEEPTRLRLTPGARAVAGAVFAQGLALSARHALAAAAPLTHVSPADPVAGPLLLATAALPAGVVAGAGLRTGPGVGLMTGALHAALLAAPSFAPHHAGPPPAAWILAAFVAVPAGLVGGWVGTLFWRPAPRPARAEALAAKAARKEPDEAWAWDRLLLGAVLAAFGVAWAHAVRDALLRNAFGADRSSVLYVAFVLAVLAVFLGGLVAGSGTRSGLRQGLLAGLLAALGVAGVGAAGDPPPGVMYPALVLGLADGSKGALGLFVLPAVVAGVAGGLFGSMLMPPISKRKPKRRVGGGEI